MSTYHTLSSDICPYQARVLSSRMPKDKKSVSTGGAWIFRNIPRDLMKRAKIAAAVEGTSIKAMTLKALEEHIQDLEKKGLLPKGK
jgi:hypothetical protein